LQLLQHSGSIALPAQPLANSLRHRRAEALGYGYKPRLRGLIQTTQVAFVPVACPFMGQATPDRV